MLIHVQHIERLGERPGRLTFRFEPSTLRHKMIWIHQRVPGAGSPDGPRLVRIGRGTAMLASVTREAGGSLVLWAPSAQEPSFALVISPLSSLVRRAKSPLTMMPAPRSHRLGCTDIRLDRLRLLYLPPDALLERQFLKELAEVTDGATPATVIIDNAHCVSEWGGDFRPCYLRLPHLIRDLRIRNPKLAVVGLTTTDVPLVRRDMREIFDLEEILSDPPERLSPSNISLQTVGLTAEGARSLILGRLWGEDFPSILNREGIAVTPPEEGAQIPANGFGNGEYAAPLSVTTLEGATDRFHPNVLLETGLQGTLNGWLRRCDVAGADGERIHCVRLAELPTGGCEADMALRKSREPTCEGVHCPFGRQSICDYGFRSAAIRAVHPGVVSATLSVLRVLDALLPADSGETEDGTTAVQDSPCLPWSADTAWETELALHRLSQIGVLDTFSTDLENDLPVFRIHGFVPGVGDAEALSGLLEFLRAHDTSFNQKYRAYTYARLRSPNGELTRDRTAYGPGIGAGLETLRDQGRIHGLERHARLFEQVALYLPRFISHIHDELAAMRFHQLWNLKEFFRSDACRFADMLRTVMAVAPEWRCRRCDRCAPDLKFARTREPEPPSDARMARTIEKLLSGWLENDEGTFDLKTADDLIAGFPEHADDIRQRAARLLESVPRNLKALYLLRELGHPHARERHAVDLMRVVLQDLNQTQGLRFYATLREDRTLRASLLDVLDDEFGAMNDPEGEKWLWDEARALEVSEERTRMLESRVMINVLAATDLTPILTRLGELAAAWNAPLFPNPEVPSGTSKE